MQKYAKIINEETKQCEVGIGNDGKFYQEIGMDVKEVEQGCDGKWYLKGFAPEETMEIKSIQKRSDRDSMLRATDIYMLSDFPISDEQRELYKQYRQYLRDLPTTENFPEVDVMSFKEWSQWIGD